MRLHDEWRLILHRSWSLRVGLVAAILSGLEGVWGLFANAPPIPLPWFAMVNFILIVAASIARLLAQSNMGGGQ